MKFSVNWIKDFVDINTSQVEVSDYQQGYRSRINRCSGKGLDNIVVGK